jgi:translation initiation factor 2 subunit 1
MNTTKELFFYPNALPIVGELVVIESISVEPCGGIKCELLEYGRREAFMPLSEISRKRIHCISREIKLGKKFVCHVLNVDEKKGYVDISKKHITNDEKEEGMIKYKNAKCVHSIISNVPNINYESVIWPLYESKLEVYNIFKYSPDEINLEEDAKVKFLQLCKHHFAIKSIKMYAEVEVSSHEHGIDVIKDVLRTGLNAGVKINLISSPLYLVSLEGLEEKKIEEQINYAIKIMSSRMAELGGVFEVKKAVCIQG